jgi:hypothetical protein
VFVEGFEIRHFPAPSGGNPSGKTLQIGKLFQAARGYAPQVKAGLDGGLLELFCEFNPGAHETIIRQRRAPGAGTSRIAHHTIAPAITNQ